MSAWASQNRVVLGQRKVKENWNEITAIPELLHWILEVGFREDQARANQGYCGENLGVIRHLAVNLLTQEKSAHGGMRAKRLKADWH
ncbi:MAG: hypothetical protein HC781_09495 [Leptolyngbyaceae cyanobacterium CSU_1_4]|nr:hypothetical protein [Leptolyngbyaceae cyanobacterium CSU_1_4]